MTATATGKDEPLTLTESELGLIVAWWSRAYGEGATADKDDALAARIAAKAGEHAAG